MPGLNYPGEAPVGGGGDEEVFNVTSSPEGGWSLIQQAKAAYYNGKTYLGWINSSGQIKVASYTHGTETTSALTLVDTPGTDDHNNPALLVRDSDKKILVAFCQHDGAHMYLSISSSAESVAAFGAATDLDSSIGASDYTYPALFQLTSVTNDPIYLFYRDLTSGDGRLAYSKSTDGGATWGARVVVMTGNTASNFIPYWSISTNGTDRIDVFSTDRDYGGSEGTVDLGHMYLDGTTDKWYTSAGVEITASKPFAHSELTQIETNVTATFATDAITSANPVVAYFVASGSDIIAKYGRWDGSSWDKGTIYTADPVDFDAFYGALAINRADPEEVFSGIYQGAGVSELYTYVSGDLGLTWDAGTAITSGSADHNLAAIPIINGVSTLPVMWLRGTWTSSSVFAWAIKGLRR